MKEECIESYIRVYLLNKGWKIRKAQKKKGEHGVDIEAWHPTWRKGLFIETKGGSGKYIHQEKHNAFYNILGQCLSRMDIEGNNPNRARIYAFGIPYDWAEVFKKKINKMNYGWNLLKLRGFLVKENGEVLEKRHTFFLKKQ